MWTDLTFPDPSKEQQFRQDLLDCMRPAEARLRVLGCLAWAGQALRASSLGVAVIALAGAVCSATSLAVALWMPRLPLR